MVPGGEVAQPGSRVWARHLDAATWDRWRAAGGPARKLDLVAIGLGDPPRRLAAPPDDGGPICELTARLVAERYDQEAIGMTLVRRGLTSGVLAPEGCLFDLLPRQVFLDTWSAMVNPLDPTDPDEVCAPIGLQPPQR